jgi:hypothetical protein
MWFVSVSDGKARAWAMPGRTRKVNNPEESRRRGMKPGTNRRILLVSILLCVVLAVAGAYLLGLFRWG